MIQSVPCELSQVSMRFCVCVYVHVYVCVCFYLLERGVVCVFKTRRPQQPVFFLRAHTDKYNHTMCHLHTMCIF